MPYRQAPDITFHQFSAKTDVFALGVVLLQLASGLPSVVVMAPGGEPQTLVEYVRSLDGGVGGTEVDLPVDTRVTRWSDDPASGDAVLKGLRRLALRCISVDKRARPPVDEVLLAIRDLLSGDGGSSLFYSNPAAASLATPAAIAAAAAAAAAAAGGPASLPLSGSDPMDLSEIGLGGLESHDVVEDEAARPCYVCAERPRDVVFQPCNHLCACSVCADQLAAEASAGGSAAFGCPLCLGPVTEVVLLGKVSGTVTLEPQAEAAPAAIVPPEPEAAEGGIQAATVTPAAEGAALEEGGGEAMAGPATLDRLLPETQ